MSDLHVKVRDLQPGDVMFLERRYYHVREIRDLCEGRTALRLATRSWEHGTWWRLPSGQELDIHRPVVA